MPRLTTTYLEMLAPPDDAAAPLPGRLRVLRAHRPTVAFYRFLYRQVGGPWQWTDRERMDDDALLAILAHPDVHVHVLYDDGTPAGYCELDYRQPGQAEIVYFGLMPHAIGQGFGRAFLGWTIREAWRHGIRRLWVHTCSRDHPRALGTYQQAGFAVYREETTDALG